MNLSIREATQNDSKMIIDYFHSADSEFLFEMGIDQIKLPSKNAWEEKLNVELNKPFASKAYYYIVWEASSKPIGHSNLSDIVYGETAKMHLHIWEKKLRLKGIGYNLIKKSIQLYFNKFALSELICEPIYTNRAPTRH